VPIHKSIKSAWARLEFPIHGCGFLFKIKEIKLLRGDVAFYVAQARTPIDAEIGQKDHPWMETN